MEPAAAEPESALASERRRLGWALALWVAHLAVLLVGTAQLSPQRQSVIRHYRTASEAWSEGRPVYGEGSEHGFLYLPAFAVLHAPFAALPMPLGGLLWRAVNLGLFGLGVWLLARALGRERAGTFFLVSGAVALACSWSSARHGQATLAMAGTMLAAAAALARGRLWSAAAWCALGVALKPLSLALVLVAAVCWRGLGVRLVPMLLLAALLPFAAQAPDYVLEQYRGFGRMIATAGSPTDRERFPDLLLTLRLLGFEPSERGALLVRAAAGAATLAAYAWIRRRAEARVAALFLYALCAAYLLAFNPRTEHNTYSLVGPALGGACAWALLAGRRGAAVLFAALALSMRVDFDVTRALTGDNQPWSKPPLLALSVAAMWVFAARRGWTMDAAALTPAAPRPAR